MKPAPDHRDNQRMSFSGFCLLHGVSDEERTKLVVYLAVFRATETIRALSVSS